MSVFLMCKDLREEKSVAGQRSAPWASAQKSSQTEPVHSRNAAWEVNLVTPLPTHSAEVTAGGLQRPLWDRTVLG